jgi:hypothetical protein
MKRGRLALAALVVVLAATVAGVSAPEAKAWTCGASVYYTNQIAYGGSETITVDVWDGAPAPGGVQVGPYHWSKISQTNYSDHISTRWTMAYQSPGTYNVWVNVSGSSCFNADGQFKIT